MKALVVNTPGKLEFADIPVPVINPYQALAKVEVCGICNSTDTKLIDGLMGWAPPAPFVLGHESVGTIVEIGERVTRYKVGDRVTRPIYRSPIPASKLQAANGGFVEYGIVTDNAAMAADGDLSMADDYNANRQMVAPQSLSPLQAALCISLSETASLIDPLPNIAGQTVLVAGTGVAGLSFAMWCKLAGARTIVLGRRASRLALATKLGADHVIDTSESGYVERLVAEYGQADVLFEGTGVVSVADGLASVLKPGGYALAYGVPPSGNKYADFWKSPAVNEQTRYAWVTDLMARGWIKSEWFVTHTWKFDEALQAFDQTRAGEVFKGFVTIS
ncbi:MAG TPA: zinc-binding dehydrogenase [Capsulimonadaceae bacterium]|jgi:threonine dehydrogenase-like Zn-dependent dehydrogenase